MSMSTHRRHLVRDWNDRMLEEAADGTRRGTRWGRGTCAFLPAALGIGALGSAIATGAMAASFNLTGQPFVLQSNGVNGSGLGAILNAPTVQSSTGTSNPAMARIGFSSATLSGLCGIVNQSFAGIPYTLVLTAGAKVAFPAAGQPWPTLTNDINAHDLYIQTASLSSVGTTTLNNAILGESADQVTVDGTAMDPTAKGLFGLDAHSGGVTLQGLNANAYDAEIIGSLSLPGLQIKVIPTPSGGVTSC